MNRNDFINLVAPVAQQEMKLSGILASLTIAQAVIESDGGNSDLALYANALFGIKASNWTGKVYSKVTKECYDGSNLEDVTACFRAYDTWEESIKDHTLFLQKERYSNLKGVTDYKEACRLIKEDGYATSPTYTQTLINCIETYKLYVYDSVDVKKEDPKMNIGVNCGHTKSGAGYGAVGLIKESAENRNVGLKLMEILRSSGHNVTDCTIDKASSVNAYLSEAVRMANSKTLDWFISIHFNAGGGKGCEVFTYEGRQYQDAIEVCSNLEALGFKNRGVKVGSGLYVIRRTTAKAMLIEVCFVDTKSDVDLYNKLGSDKVAEAIAKAIIGTINGTIEITPSTSTGSTKQGYVKVICDELNIRKSASWDDSAVCGTVRRNEVFTVMDKITPKGSSTPLYKLKSGVFITSSKKYVTYYEK